MNLDDIPLGKNTEYPDRYDPELLFPIAREEKRTEIGLADPAPFNGKDSWTAYEMSWLDSLGKPQVAIGLFEIPCNSPAIVESKSFKLYLNSFNQNQFADWSQVKACLHRDLAAAIGAELDITLYTVDEFQTKGITTFNGLCLDELSVECSQYDYAPDLLRCVDGGKQVSEQLYSHLLKSNCLITSQPDWASVFIAYEGAAIDHESLLQYLVSFRNHNEFHEQCVERIYQDVMHYCQPQKLTVYARYTRRGGLDINPWRSNHATQLPFARMSRQ
ncbi:NADPH-dependent 7-cyano-7-deazaguanine reductase QueF [Pleionea sp. CnH1-48]|uniref:NADPH-dependent 7-cyano-7-deazaguanine reductase QueF n=1 Tax=Pleionea sp. CnH1-48 TaxID=2954494 RepID=UPI0020981658|nr:NADPH-dependent 7-cyano-7-deazaguanine reductase QueF [Pleionea sp. CnH1-48]MCO7224830.1 NADPH-dependent 7-cyano-7-deazaguanine reductase QueF [Pleionea sp. CnH1-48]